MSLYVKVCHRRNEHIDIMQNNTQGILGGGLELESWQSMKYVRFNTMIWSASLVLFHLLKIPASLVCICGSVLSLRAKRTEPKMCLQAPVSGLYQPLLLSPRCTCSAGQEVLAWGPSLLTQTHTDIKVQNTVLLHFWKYIMIIYIR